ncbi:hypothetical protein BAOM_2990 [Peribacillus asahii]|uniref:DNA-directed RNA polymerase subunit beta n=1 Tax=Peribacillus asahii TaxID=228899 RepID=A0A3T0KT32_9BACI|nr:hypothetical protein [Peribacillus asahii]AZV43599.1 hypothetical protein BAOM_2990 [Peribacillus asahii]
MKKSKIEIAAMTVIGFVTISMIATLVLYGFVGIKLINNPEVFGEWFAKLVEGFNKE